jgi:hypothetical protein
MSRSICYDVSCIRLLFAFCDFDARIRFDLNIQEKSTWQMIVPKQ